MIPSALLTQERRAARADQIAQIMSQTQVGGCEIFRLQEEPDTEQSAPALGRAEGWPDPERRHEQPANDHHSLKPEC